MTAAASTAQLPRRLSSYLRAWPLEPSEGGYDLWRIEFDLDGRSSPVAVVRRSREFGYCSITWGHYQACTTATMGEILAFMRSLERAYRRRTGAHR